MKDAVVESLWLVFASTLDVGLICGTCNDRMSRFEDEDLDKLATTVVDSTLKADVKYGDTCDWILCPDDELVKDSKKLVVACCFCAVLDFREGNTSIYSLDGELGK